MSESEIATTSSTSTSRFNDDDKKIKKKLINSQTQHGNAMTADEENIVVLGLTFSPVRETSDVFVWHEDVIEQVKEDEDVSEIQLFLVISRRF